MSHRLLPVSLTLLALLVAPAHGADSRVTTGRLIVKFVKRTPPTRLMAASKAIGAEYIQGGTTGPYVLVRERQPAKIAAARQKGVVVYVEPEVVMATPESQASSLWGKVLSPPPAPLPPGPPAIGTPISGSTRRDFQAQQLVGLIPTDPLYPQQWGFQDTLAGIHLARARRRTLGTGSIVAIVDTGVRQSLSDLARVDFLPAYNAITAGSGANDDNGHGSHIAGTIAQATNNGIGGAGIAPAARILPVKVLNAQGRGTNYTIGVGIRYAVDHGAQVINLSIGGVASQTLKDAVQYALSKGVTLCCATGNSGAGQITYPAAYPGVLAVGASNKSGGRATFSQYGAGISLVAPGQDILQQTFNATTNVAGYYYYSGTSMATPMVAGTVALLKAMRAGLRPPEIKTLLQATARDVGASGYDLTTGSGLLDAAAACEQVAGGAPPEPLPPPPPTPVPPGPTPGPTPPPLPAPSSTAEETLALFNGERAKAGLPALALEPRLLAAAVSHAAEMRERGVMSHTGKNGSNPGQRMSLAGYPWRTYGEVIAMGQPTPAAVTQAWMNSPGHRAIILGRQFTEVGIAKDGPYWCGVFGAR